MQQYFITGTDTEVGKTYVSEYLLRAAAKVGLKTLAYKPVSAGCERVGDALVNEDALKLQRAATVALPISQVNPIAFAPPIAPHIAANLENTTIDIDAIDGGLKLLQQHQPDLLLVEGAGGWRLPIGQGGFLSDVVKQWRMDVIIVVGMRLGCLNHALLTAEAVRADGLNIKGWIANQLSADMPNYQQNIQTLESLLKAPKLAEIPFSQPNHIETLNDLAKIFS
ncbi:dethiobiotin synthase [Alteromonas ponticola]|uniref:ATP-dependent dethiobiotin synthetase BioD n=1 Tax=Alteromonas aquimaris TaxID=2998417 RepID=A0ABT3P726_9ALTE|nr:dethiobiotin synthase [Alteromonas aquimaris]MCW8107881.1 dethiobiotin synthase [Alteromonas aquimaris]